APNTPFPALLIGALPEAAPGPRTTLISRSLVGPPGAGRLGPMHAIAADFLRGQDHDRAGRAAATAALERLRGSYPRPSGQPPEGMDLLLTHLHGYWSNTVDAPAGPIGLWIGRLMKAFGNPVDADRHWGALAEALGRSGVWDVSYWQAELHRSTAESQRDRLPQARDAFAHLWGNPVLAPQEQGAMAHALVGAIADSGDVEGARDFLEPIVEAMAADPDAYGDRRLILMGRLAQYYVRTGERAKAVAMVDSVWGRLQQVELETPELTLLLLENLGIALFELEDMARAKELFARAIKLAPLAIHSLWDQSNLACMMLHIGERVRGMALLKEVFAARVQIFGPHHYNTLVTQLNIGIQERESGNLEAALAVLVPCTEGWLKTTAPDHHACLLARSNVVTTLLALGRPAEAKPWAHELVATAESRWAGAPPTLKYRLLEARCDAALGDPEALSTIRRLKAAVLEALDSADGLVEEAELAEAETLQLQGRHLEAAALLGSLLARLQARLDPWHDERRMVAGMLLRSLIADGQSAEVGALVRGELGWLFEAAPESLTPAERGILTLARRWAEHPSGSNGWSHPGIGLPSIVPPISRTV
ncbi:MAG TPA: hypothetical protein VEI97_14245, partial [bacterium]|nr:hypothetical protein [bacterium]